MANILLVVAVVGVLVALSGSPASAAEPAPEPAIRSAISKSLPLLELAAKGSMESRKNCFTCHHQGLIVMATTTARTRAFTIDAELLDRQLKFTTDFLAQNQENYLKGKGQGGQALTAGTALWSLELGGWKPDATTAAVAEYLLRWQNDLDHWKVQTTRPPSESGHFAISYLALRGLKTFGTGEQRQRIANRTDRVRQWVEQTPAEDTEDRVFRLRALHVSGAAPDATRDAAHNLLHTQHEDGGWAQITDVPSDAYATGTALVALHQAGGISPQDPAYQRGLQWLLHAQLEDGSWHVKTRSKPIQTYYESGYPHGEDQFISITAACWATAALALALPVDPPPTAAPAPSVKTSL